MKCCVSTDVGTWTNWLTFERDPNHSALGVSHIMRYINARYLIYILTYIIRMPEPDCFLRYHIGYGTLQHCLCCQRAALLRENMNRHTLGHFTIWISLSLRLSRSPKFGLRPKKSKVVFRLDSANRSKIKLLIKFWQRKSLHVFANSKIKKYGDISDESPMTSAMTLVSLHCGDWLISTTDWGRIWALRLSFQAAAPCNAAWGKICCT